MLDVITQAKGLTQPGTGSHYNDWGAILNANIGMIDSALGGTLIVPLTGNVTLSANQTKSTGYNFTGIFAAAATVTFPSYFGFGVFINNTNQSVSCGIAGGNFATIPSGQVGTVWSDGTHFQTVANVLPTQNVTVLGTVSASNLSLTIGFNNYFTLILAVDIATFTLVSILPASPPVYLSIILSITQDSVGTRTIAWPSNVKWQGGFTPALSTAAGATDVVQFISFDSGVHWFGTIAFQIAP